MVGEDDSQLGRKLVESRFVTADELVFCQSRREELQENEERVSLIDQPGCLFTTRLVDRVGELISDPPPDGLAATVARELLGGSSAITLTTGV